MHWSCLLVVSDIAEQGYIGKDGHGHAGTDRRTRTDGHGQERRTVMEKTGTYGKDGQLWKRRTVMEKTGTYGKDRNKVFKSEIFSRLTPRTTSITHIVNKIQNTILTSI